MELIEKKSIKTMIDLGCNDCQLMKKIQRGTTVQRLIGMDIDSEILKKAIDVRYYLTVQNIAPEANQSDLQYQR